MHEWRQNKVAKAYKDWFQMLEMSQYVGCPDSTLKIPFDHFYSTDTFREVVAV